MEIKKTDVDCWVQAKDFDPNKNLYGTYYVQTNYNWIYRISDKSDYTILPPMTLMNYKKIHFTKCKDIDKLLDHYEIVQLPSANDHVEGGQELVTVVLKKFSKIEED